jgi:hypothetical protein
MEKSRGVDDQVDQMSQVLDRLRAHGEPAQVFAQMPWPPDGRPDLPGA